MPKPQLWLNRDLIVGPYLALATTDAEYQRAMNHMKVPRDKRPRWVTEGANATTHSWKNDSGEQCCIVAIECGEKTPIQIAALLVHEAVHVKQEHFERIGETKPSIEFEAYTVQALSQRLMTAYAARLK
jgi:hypothetical protein